jgi:hypothetical protein
MTRLKRTGKKMSVAGFIEAFDYDDGASGLKLVTDEDEYIVQSDKIGKRLGNLEGEEVEATGMVSQDESGAKHIKVESFEAMEFNDNDDYNDDYYDDEYFEPDDRDRYDQ